LRSGNKFAGSAAAAASQASGGVDVAEEAAWLALLCPALVWPPSIGALRAEIAGPR